MIELIDGLPRHVVGIRVTGRVSNTEFREVVTPAVARSLRWRQSIRLYYELGSRFPGSGWDDLDLGFEQAARCERIAIVTDIAWVRLTVKAIRFLIPGAIRVFDTMEAASARAWITALPGSRADTDGTVPVRACNGRLQRARRPSLERARRAASKSATRAAPAFADAGRKT
jgi:SpoIIAA-like